MRWLVAVDKMEQKLEELQREIVEVMEQHQEKPVVSLCGCFLLRMVLQSL